MRFPVVSASPISKRYPQTQNKWIFHKSLGFSDYHQALTQAGRQHLSPLWQMDDTLYKARAINQSGSPFRFLKALNRPLQKPL
jgi:hypothetical protein